MTDVRIYQSDEGGAIDVVNGDCVLSTDGLESAAYLSLFGGNEDDSGIQGDDSKQWWANFAEPDPERIYRSETAFLLRSIPLVPSNLRRLEDAATRDLGWLEDSIADAVIVEATMPGLNAVKLAVTIEIKSVAFKFVFLPPQPQ